MAKLLATKIDGQLLELDGEHLSKLRGMTDEKPDILLQDYRKAVER